MDKNELVEEFFFQLSDEDKEEWLNSRKKCKRLFYFIREMGGYLTDNSGNSIAGGDSVEYLHGRVCDFWQDDSIKRKGCLMPRGWFKTIDLTCWGSVHAYLHNNESRIGIPTEVKDKSEEWVKWIGQMIVSHPRLRWIYPELTVVDQSYTKQHTYSASKILLPRNGIYPDVTFTAIGIYGSSQGGHFDYLDPDDLCGEKAFESPTIMEDSYRWVDNINGLLVESDINSPTSSIIRMKGTHWAMGDTYCYIQQRYPEYKWMITPALKDEGLEDKENITYIQNPEVSHGESNFPERNSTKYYIDMMTNPETKVTFWTQHQNNPGRGGEGLNKFDEAWIKYFQWETIDDDLYLRCKDDKELFKLSEIPQYGILDMGGFKEIKLIKKGSVNIQMIGGQARGSIKKFITSFWAGKLKEPSDFADRLVKAHEAMWPHHWDIEPYGQHEFIRKYLVEETKKQGKGIRIWAINLKQADVSEGAKHNRITNMIPMVANGELYVHESFKHLISEIITYPNSLTVDGLDALGWLRQLHWSHKARENVNTTNAELEQQRLNALGDSRTGY